MIELNNILLFAKEKIKKGDNKDLANNTIALTILNFFNFVLPLFTIPVLLNHLGAEAYGVVNIYIALYAIFQKIVDYGFNYVGSRRISLTDKSNERNTIFSEILVCKLINAIFVIICTIIYFILAGTTNIIIALIISSELIGTALSMYWLFQGLKEMHIITWITSVTKIVYSILIIIFIRVPGDLILYSVLYSLVSLVIGLSGLLVAVSNKFNLRFTKISFKDLIVSYKEGWHMFIAGLCSGITTNLCTVILGNLKGDAAVAYFSAGYKIVQALSLVFSAITQAMYPFSCMKFKESFNNGILFVKAVMKWVLTFIGIACLIISVLSPFIFKLFFENIYWSYYPVAIIGCIWLFFSFFNNFLGVQILVAGGFSSTYRKAFTMATIITICGYYVLIPSLSEYGSIMALLLGEVILTIILYYQIEKIKNISQV